MTADLPLDSYYNVNTEEVKPLTRVKSDATIIKRNMSSVFEFSRELREMSIVSSARSHDDHIRHVQEQKKLRDRERIDSRRRDLLRREHAREERLLKDKSCHSWLAVLAVVSFYNKMYNKYREIKKDQRRYAVLFRCVLRLQYWARKIVLPMRAARKTAACALLVKNTRVFLLKTRIRKKKEAADMLKWFFKEAGNIQPLAAAARRYRFLVIRCQQYVRKWMKVQRARRALWRLQWARIEEDLAMEQQEQITGALSPDGKSKSKGKKKSSTGKGKGRKKVNRSLPVLRIPEDIRETLLTKQMIRKMTQYLQNMKVYEQVLQDHHVYLTRLEALQQIKSIFEPMDSDPKIETAVSDVSVVDSSNDKKNVKSVRFKEELAGRQQLTPIPKPTLPRFGNVLSRPALVDMVKAGFDLFRLRILNDSETRYETKSTTFVTTE
eukprot:GILK01003934.1.p1 GENE.GILK01003934.1~~GILK01003934.1.p1  ORF type:complete len:497 (-),score=68.94 GILK01003934.1:240-1550(-)